MAEERLWAPWRLEYIRRPKSEECIFCVGSDGADDESRYVVHRGERCFVMLNAYPYASGHVMVSPYTHVSSIEELEVPALSELMSVAQRSLAALRANYGPEGFNLGINQGSAGGAGIRAHLHQHVVPRWTGDANFITVVGGTKTLPQLLVDTRRLLAEAWDAS